MDFKKPQPSSPSKHKNYYFSEWEVWKTWGVLRETETEKGQEK